MLFHNNLPIIFNLDDFCEDIMTKELWDLLFELKRRSPYLKVTMFTIPLRCSKHWIEHIKNSYDWIELHYHGSSHLDQDEWLDKVEFDQVFPEYFYKGFKAPWWRMGQSTATMFDKLGYVLSCKRGYFDISASKIYRFNIGKEIIPGIAYMCNKYKRVHGHVQSQKRLDGLPDMFDKVADMFGYNDRFMFISELFI